MPPWLMCVCVSSIREFPNHYCNVNHLYIPISYGYTTYMHMYKTLLVCLNTVHTFMCMIIMAFHSCYMAHVAGPKVACEHFNT